MLDNPPLHWTAAAGRLLWLEWSSARPRPANGTTLCGGGFVLPHTTLEPRDDATFLAVIDRIIAALVLRDRPQDVHLVHVDNWFGPKWLRYSGKGVVAFPMGYAANRVVALDDHYQEKLTFPPFTRNRIVSEHYFARTTAGAYEEQCPGHLVHRRRWRWREQNLHRRVADFSASGLFVWYSSGTVGNDRASLLVYGSIGESTYAWYAGFMLRDAWQIEHVKGIDRDALLALISGDVGDAAGGGGPAAV